MTLRTLSLLFFIGLLSHTPNPILARVDLKGPHRIWRTFGPAEDAGIGVTTAVISAQENRPAVTYESLMDIRFYPDRGAFYVETLGLVFPPPGDPAAELTIRKASGETVGKVPLRLGRWGRFPAFAWLSPRGVPGTIEVGQPGDYVMAVKLGTEEITTMPFTMKVEGSTDPFNPKKTFYLQGPWTSWAYLSTEVERPQDAITFNIWLSLREIPGAAGKQQRASVHLLRGSEELASGGAIVSADNWLLFSFSLLKPNRYPFTIEMLKAQDGNYTVVYKAEGKPIRSFRFQVKGGEIQRPERSQLGYSPRTDFLSPRIIATVRRTERVMQDIYWLKAESK